MFYCQSKETNQNEQDWPGKHPTGNSYEQDCRYPTDHQQDREKTSKRARNRDERIDAAERPGRP